MLAKSRIVRRWLSPVDYSGIVLLNLSEEQLNGLKSTEFGDLYEKNAIEVLEKLNFTDISRINLFYDLECKKDGQVYYIEVKGRKDEKTPIVSTQINKLLELKMENKLVFWVFITLKIKENKVYAEYSLEEF